MNILTKIGLIISLFAISIFQIFSQVKTDSLSLERINVFLDCEFCDENYTKEQINFVNYVRDSKAANIHILITRQNTGSGGKEYSIFFIGQENFEFMNDIFTFNSDPDFSNDEIRSGLTKIFKAGLIRYLTKLNQAKNITISYNQEDADKKQNDVIDKWKNWVFDINLNGYFNGEESYKNNYFYSGASINKVNEKQKIRISYYTSLNQSIFKIDDTTTYKSTSKSNQLYTLWVKSITNHWSAGFTTSQYSSTYNNTKFRSSLYPAIEYNIFPYSESNSRQLRILYKIGFMHVQYLDSTIYDKTQEDLFSQNLSVTFNIQKKWGSISTSMLASNYLHDFSKNNLNCWTELSIRVFKGFSVNLYSQFSIIHDQLFLSKKDITAEEILLQKRQMATQFSYYSSIGISYTFGSIYNNIVNPRFGD